MTHSTDHQVAAKTEIMGLVARSGEMLPACQGSAPDMDPWLPDPTINMIKMIKIHQKLA